MQQWKRRKPGESIEHVGLIWCSDGNRVWPVDSVGHPRQFAGANHVLFWMPANVSAPPDFEGVAVTAANVSEIGIAGVLPAPPG